MATTRTPIGPTLVDVVVASCRCGMFPLEHAIHRTPRQAWEALAAHVALNPTKCDRLAGMHRDRVPAALAATLPAAGPTEPAGFALV